MAETLRELVVALSLDSSKVFTLISLRKQQIAKLDELVKARFVEMFGDPVKNPKKWATKCFDDVCDGIGDGLHGTPEYDDNGDYPFINGNLSSRPKAHFPLLGEGAMIRTVPVHCVYWRAICKRAFGNSPNARFFVGRINSSLRTLPPASVPSDGYAQDETRISATGNEAPECSC